MHNFIHIFILVGIDRYILFAVNCTYGYTFLNVVVIVRKFIILYDHYIYDGGSELQSLIDIIFFI